MKMISLNAEELEVLEKALKTAETKFRDLAKDPRLEGAKDIFVEYANTIKELEKRVASTPEDDKEKI